MAAITATTATAPMNRAPRATTRCSGVAAPTATSPTPAATGNAANHVPTPSGGIAIGSTVVAPTIAAPATPLQSCPAGCCADATAIAAIDSSIALARYAVGTPVAASVPHTVTSAAAAKPNCATVNAVRSALSGPNAADPRAATATSALAAAADARQPAAVARAESAPRASRSGTKASASRPVQSQARMPARGPRDASAPPAISVARAVKTQPFDCGGSSGSAAVTVSARKTTPSEPIASAENRSRRRARSAEPPRNAAAIVPTIAARGHGSARSGLKKMNTTAATATSAAPATASTDCTVADARAAPASPAPGDGAAAEAACGGAVSTADSAAALAGAAIGMRGTCSSSACRARSASAAFRDASQRSRPMAPAKSAPHAGQRWSSTTPVTQTGQRATSSSSAIAVSLHACVRRALAVAAVMRHPLSRRWPPDDRRAPTRGCRPADTRAPGRWRRGS